MGKQQDLLFKTLFDTATEGIIVVDDKGEILLVNPRVIELFGYEEMELIGQKIEMLIPERFRQVHVSKREKFTNSPSKRIMGLGLDLWAKRKSGEEFPIEVGLNYFENNNKRFITVLLTDITLRKNAERELFELNKNLEKKVFERTIELDKALEIANESQKLYKAISRNFPNGVICVLDKNLNYIFIEGKELGKFSQKSDELIGSSYLNLFPEEEKELLKTQLLEVFTGINTTFEIKRGESVYILNTVPLFDAKNEIKNILIVENNITALKKAAEKTEKALEQQKQLNEFKSRFVAMASHEFRTPLSTILSSISLISKYQKEDEQDRRDKHIGRVKASIHHLTSILNDFLSIEKLDEGKVSIQNKFFNLKHFFSELKDEMDSYLKNGQKLEIAYSLIDENISSDPFVLKNTMINLVSNAVKYSDENSSIRIKVNTSNQKLTVSVSDQGIGIPQEEQKHLFDRFFRAKNATNIQGTGLGLNIVKRYIDILQGEISFKSELGKGTTFTFTIPYQL